MKLQIPETVDESCSAYGVLVPYIFEIIRMFLRSYGVQVYIYRTRLTTRSTGIVLRLKNPIYTGLVIPDPT